MLNLLCNTVETNIRLGSLGTNFFCGYSHFREQVWKGEISPAVFCDVCDGDRRVRNDEWSLTVLMGFGARA